VRDQGGAPLRSAAMIGAEQPIRIEFADGEVAALARGGTAPTPANPTATSAPAPRGGKPGKRGPSDKQGSLF
jgi:exodeoxyribonuclease VII large subunit